LTFYLPRILDIVKSGLVGKGDDEGSVGYAGDVSDVRRSREGDGIVRVVEI